MMVAVDSKIPLHQLAEVNPIPEEVRAWGQGLSDGTVNKPCRFYLDATRAGHSDFDIMVRGPSQAAITFDEKCEGIYVIDYKATLPGEYSVIVKYNEKDIHGSPFPVRISFLSRHPNEVKKTRKLKRGKHRTNEAGEEDTGNDGNDSPDLGYGSLKRGNSCRMDRIVHEAGMTVTKSNSDYAIADDNNNQLPANYNGNRKKETTSHELDSVFKFESEQQQEQYVPDWKTRMGRITVTEGLDVQGYAGRASLFVIDKCLEKIDKTKLVVAIEGPARCPIKVFKNTLTSVNVLYLPEKAGEYRVHVTYCGEPIENAPFSFITMKARQNSSRSSSSTSAHHDEETSSYYLTVWYGFDVANCEINCEVHRHDNQTAAMATTTKKSRDLIEVRLHSPDSGQHNCVLTLEHHQDGIVNLFDLDVPRTFSHPGSERNRSASTVSIPAHHQMVANEEHYICGANGYIAVTIDGNDAADLSYQQREDGKNVIGYRMSSSGGYSMSVKDSRDHYIAKPYQLSVVEKMENDQ